MAPKATMALEVFIERNQIPENLSILTYTEEEEVEDYFDADWAEQDADASPSIGAVGLVTPIGLGLVAGGAVIGGAAFLMKSHLSNIPSAETDTAGTEAKDEEKGLWVLVEMSPDSVVCTFDDEYKARNAFLNSSATSKALFDPEEKIVLEIGWPMNGDVVDG
ncbi:hypothetical protein PC122_g737 [Phytophthora cactorum]|nr:hypothetical protein PC122_g737 [Phytophthora cactorum]